MGRLVIKLDKPMVYCLLEGRQLLYAAELPAENVSELLDKIGDYPVEEVAVYAKLDTRRETDGVVVDRIRTDKLDMTFRMAGSDYDFVKAAGLRFGAEKLSIYSAYRHYPAILGDGIVVDSFGGHSFVVASVLDGALQSLDICSSERLQRTIEASGVFNITYAAQGAIPELGNIETVPPELRETLAFLQFVMFGQPCYTVELTTGEAFAYGDADEEPREYVLAPEDFTVAVETVITNLGPKTVKAKRRITKRDVILFGMNLVAGLLTAVSLLGLLDVDARTGALGIRQAEQRELMDRQTIEERFLEHGALDAVGGSFYQHMNGLNSALNNGAVMSVRFAYDRIELTLFTLDEAMKDLALSELGAQYAVESCEYEESVTNPESGAVYQQYHVVLVLQ